MIQKIFVFGNPDLEMDSLPLKILPQLRKHFPGIEFVIKDPNEEWVIENEGVVVLDTVAGVKDVTIFDSLEKFTGAPRIGMHDFDALANLKFLQKLGKIKKIKIIAVPQNLNEETILRKVSEVLKNI